MNKKEANNGYITQQVERIVNMIPGTLTYKGTHKERFSIEAIRFNEESSARERYGSVWDLNKDTRGNELKLPYVEWLNITGFNQVDEIKALGQNYDVDSVILEQILSVSKHCFFQHEEDLLFNDLQMFYIKDNHIIRENICILYKDDLVMTFQEKPGDVFDSIRQRIADNIGRIRKEDSSYTYFCILDALVDHYIQVTEFIREKITEMEFLMFENEDLNYKDLHELRKQIMLIRMNIATLEKMGQDLASLPKFDKLDHYFESLLHHIRMVVSEIDMEREAIDGLYENYMLTNSNNMNETMTTLTIFSAIFIPLSFVAGIFGMNFQWVPLLDNPNGFIYFIIGCVVTAISMLGFFKFKKWF